MAECEKCICNSKERDEPGVPLSLILSFKINVSKEKTGYFQISRYSYPSHHNELEMNWDKTSDICK